MIKTVAPGSGARRERAAMALVGLLFSIWASSASAQVNHGFWDGSQSPSGNFDLTVSNQGGEKVKRIALSWSLCNSGSSTISTSASIVGGSFSVNAGGICPGISLSGSFTSATMASGSVTYTYTPIPFVCSCSGSTTRSWNATWSQSPDVEVKLASSAGSVAESAGSAPVGVTLTTRTGAATTADVTVSYATSDGSAAAGSDYTQASGSLTFPAGTASGTTQNVNVPITDDTSSESSETLTLTLSTLASSLAGASLESPTAHTLTITDNDAPPPTLSISDVTINEGSAGQAAASFNVTLSSTSVSTVTVEYATADGTATAGTDYTSTSGTLTFAPGETGKTIDVPVLGDSTDEPDETFSVTLRNPTNATLSKASGLGTITDDDLPPNLSIGGYVTVPEGDSGASAAIFHVTLNVPSSRSVTVDYATADGSAIGGSYSAVAASDYTAASGSLTFAPGEKSKTVSVSVLGDTIEEPSETFTLNLSNAVNAMLVRASGTCTIANDDGTRTNPAISIADRSVAEGSAVNAAFRLVLSVPSEQTVWVDYFTADGTALAGSDYANVFGTVMFTPGRTNQSVYVPIVTDGTAEGSESFFVDLGASNAIILDGQAMGTIADPPTAQKIAMYRSYNRSTDYHFFTTDLNSKNFAVGTLGFQDESTPIPFYVWNSQQSGTTPLFRMYNPNLGRHFYTASSGSRDFIMGIGGVYEKEEGFVFPLSTSPVPSGATELFLLYNNNSGTHLFTADAGQKDAILGLFQGIWVQHTSVGFVFTAP